MKSILFSKWNSQVMIPAEEKHQGIIKKKKKKIVRSSNFEFCVWGTSGVTLDKSFKSFQVAQSSHR